LTRRPKSAAGAGSAKRGTAAASAPDTLRREPGYAVREAATRLLVAVLDKRQALDAALESDAAFAALAMRDRAFARAIVGTALRRHGTINAALATLMATRPPRAGNLQRILEIAAAQVLFMRTADHAAVSLAVDQVAADRNARHFKGLANAVLRRLVRERDALLPQLHAVNLDTPDWLWQRWSATYGEATAWQIADAHLLEPALDISVKGDEEGWAGRLGGIVLPTGSVRLIPAGPVEAMAGFTGGEWWVQDAAAALPAKLLGNVAGKRVADLCAAPGGKTAALAAAGARVTALDVSAERLRRLADNLKRLGLEAETVQADVLKWSVPGDALFDAVLLDAPCSATGTIRRHPDVAWLKKPDDIAALAARQRQMIARAATFLKPGGTLIYCTCSLEPEEGEAHLASTLADLPLTLAPVAAHEVGGLTEILPGDGTVRTLPSHLANAEDPRLGGLDGFFIMRLVKRG
jgi:16S rRNA (cytosine967-C5)-methyltransferase